MRDAVPRGRAAACALPDQGEGELHLRTADNEPFGIVNVGDSQALYKLLGERGNPDLALEREAGFARRLFADVDRADSTVNIVIGARRFIAGWNSWRVSAMGLMHVGVGEGPEIIQMFGRGVRLKGRGMSLKRHRYTPGEPPADSDGLTDWRRCASSASRPTTCRPSGRCWTRTALPWSGRKFRCRSHGISQGRS